MDITQIDTRVGTESKFEFSHGNTLPLTGMPFSMNYLSVQTSTKEDSWFFNPEDHTFAGLRLTHQPSPWIGDFQHFLFRFKTHNIEDIDQIDDYLPQKAIFQPDLIAADIVNQEVKVIATADIYGGVIKTLNYSNHPLHLIIDGQNLEQLNVNHDLIAFKTQNFSSSEDPNFTMWTVIEAPHFKFEKAKKDKEKTALIFKIEDNSEISFATSFISLDQAILNLSRQPSFDKMHQKNIDQWNKIFNQIEIEDSQKEKVLTFYENLYRCFLFPMQFYEINSKQEAIHYSTSLKKVAVGKMFTNVGFWDVYRSSFPLYSLLCPTKYIDFLEGFYNSYQEAGYLPRWLSPDERGMMPGTMLDVLIADAAIKKLPIKHLSDYYQAMIKGAETSSKNAKYGREGLEEYNQLGYVSNNYPESVNKTLDYAYSDWAISTVAKVLGKKQDAEFYAKRSLNYRNLFDQECGLMHPKDPSGKFIAKFNSHDWGQGFTEGSAWQNSFNIYQDIPGLIKLYGSKEKFITKLKELVNQNPTYNVGSYGQTIHEMREMVAQPFGQLAISNQPSFHLAYLFALAGKPHDTEILVRQLLHSFNSSFKGYPGDEDNGSMAAWYIWSSIGLYPEAPGSGKYVFGIPSYDYVKINLPDNQLEFITYNNDDTHNYVDIRKFNNQLCQQEISHSKLIKGGKIYTRLCLLPE